jgi:hypothetical protein
MTKLAHFDHTSASPQPVIGWYDTDEFDYQSLPNEADLLTLTQDQWDNRLNTPFVSGGTLIAPPSAQLFAQAQAAHIALLRTAYQQAIQQPVTYTSKGGVTKTYQADPGSVSNLQSMLLAFSATQTVPSGFYWVSADNTQVPFTYADMQGLAQALGTQGAAAFQHLQTQKAAILAATTVDAVQAITW